MHAPSHPLLCSFALAPPPRSPPSQPPPHTHITTTTTTTISHPCTNLPGPHHPTNSLIRLSTPLQARFPAAAPVRSELEQLVASNAANPAVHAVPEAVTLLATPSAAAAGAPQLAQLASWAPAPLLQCMSLISTSAGRWAQDSRCF